MYVGLTMVAVAMFLYGTGVARQVENVDLGDGTFILDTPLAIPAYAEAVLGDFGRIWFGIAVLLASVMSRAINGSAAFGATVALGMIIAGLYRVVALCACRFHGFGRLLKGQPACLVRNGELLRPAFTGLVGDPDQRLFVGGAASLLSEVRADELEACQRLLEALEKRAAILEMLGETLGSRRPFVRVGEELENPALREVSLVGASYGLSTRTLGAVSLVGPLRMDYEKAIRSVRAAAHELSRFVASVYEDN